MTTITETVNLPAATPPKNLSVIYQLVGTNGAPVEGFDSSSHTTVVSSLPMTLDGTGAYTVSLTPNSQITPSGTAWARVITGPGISGIQVDYLTVPASGSYRVDQVLTTAPASIASSALSLLKTGSPEFHADYYGAKGDGTTDDSASIQSAIDAAYTAGGGLVRIRAATYVALNLKIKRRVSIVGAGWGSVLKAPATATTADAVIRSTEDSSQQTAWNNWPQFSAIRNLKIDGNARSGAACDGIRFASRDASGNLEPAITATAAWGPSYTDPTDFNDGPALIDSVLVMDAGRHGFFMGQNCRQAKLTNCYAFACRQVGFYIAATDYFLTQCDAGACADGFWLWAQEGRVEGCKAWYSCGNYGAPAGFWYAAGTSFSGLGDGFLLFGRYAGNTITALAGLTVSGCVSQDNYNYGTVLNEVRGCKVEVTSGGDWQAALGLFSNVASCQENTVRCVQTWGDRPSGSPTGSVAQSIRGLVLSGSTVSANTVAFDSDSSGRDGSWVNLTLLNSAAIGTNRLLGRVFEAWTTVTGGIGFQNSWVDQGSTFQTVRYRRVNDRVQIEGSLKSGSSGNTAFTLPAGYRPVADRIFPCTTQGGVGFVWITASTGTVQPFQTTGNITTACYLGDIDFSVL